MTNKNLLIISYNYAPRASASAIRPTSIAKYISKFGWTPFVLTTSNPDKHSAATDPTAEVPKNTTMESAYSLNISTTIVYYFVRITKLIFSTFFKRQPPKNLANEIVFPDYNIGWIPFCFLKAKKIIKRNNIDLVYITCKPFSSAIVGYFLKRRFPKIKIVIEFQDPWSVTPYHQHSGRYLKYAKYTEEKILKKTDLFLVVTHGHKLEYLNEYTSTNIKCAYIGYDKEKFDRLYKHEERNDKFIIMHTGTFYLNRSPENLLRAIVEIGNENIEFWNIGRVVSKYQTHFDAYSEYRNIHVFGWLPHREMLKILGNASLLYLNQARPVIPNAKCTSVSAKTFEYLATGIPILADMSNGENAKLIRRYSQNYHIIHEPSVEQYKTTITAAYQSWKRKAWIIGTKDDYYKRFGHKDIVADISRMFNEL